MSIIFDILIGLFVFSVIVLVHELGHFLMAKRAGIKVEEFGLGLPPRIWGKKNGETIYSINAIPFGGFVRMLGEDALDPKMRKKKRSFAAASIGQRISVVVAGVFMNFFLVWILLTGLLTFGIDPILTQDDVIPAAENGVISIEDGVKIKSVETGGLAEILGLKEGDLLTKINGNLLNIDYYSTLSTEAITFESISYLRDGKESFVMVNEPHNDFLLFEDLGADFYNLIVYPRLTVFALDRNSSVYESGLKSGDTILSVNGELVFDDIRFMELIKDKDVLDLGFLRDGVSQNLEVELGAGGKDMSFDGVFVSSVVNDSPAAKAGIKDGDLIVSVDGVKILNTDLFFDIAKGFSDDTLIKVEVWNGFETKFLNVQPENKKVGIYMSDIYYFNDLSSVLFYSELKINSILDIQKQKYPIYQAWYKSIYEGVRLSKITAVSFFSAVKTIFTTGVVPEGVAGPVGIFQMSSISAKAGVVSFLLFIALISLALGVMNILPIPALDGGRLVFILIEWIMGKPVNQKLETYIHVFFYLMLIGLVLFISYFDVLRLFK